MVFGWKHFLKQKAQSKDATWIFFSCLQMHCLLHLCTIRCAYFLNGAHCAALYPSVTGVLLSPSVLNISLEFSMSGLYKTTCQNIYKTQSFAPTNFCGLKDCGVFLYLWWTQAMRFGRLPDWALDLSSQIHNSVLKFKSMDSKCSTKTDPISSPSMAVQSQCPLPEDILLREPLFDQMIANSYEPGEVRFCNDSLLTLIRIWYILVGMICVLGRYHGNTYIQGGCRMSLMVNNWCTCDDRESQLMWIFFGLKMALQLSLYSHLVSCALEVFQTLCVHVQTRWMGTSMRTTSWMVSDPLKVVVPWELDSCMMCMQTTWSLLLWKICEVEIGCYPRTVKELLGEG